MGVTDRNSDPALPMLRIGRGPWVRANEAATTRTQVGSILGEVLSTIHS